MNHTLTKEMEAKFSNAAIFDEGCVSFFLLQSERIRPFSVACCASFSFLWAVKNFLKEWKLRKLEVKLLHIWILLLLLLIADCVAAAGCCCCSCFWWLLLPFSCFVFMVIDEMTSSIFWRICEFFGSLIAFTDVFWMQSWEFQVNLAEKWQINSKIPQNYVKIR